MRRMFAFSAAVLMSGCVQESSTAASTTQYQLSREQLAMIQEGVGRATGLPNLLLVGQVAASTNEEQTITACGMVSLDPTFERGNAFIGIFGLDRFSVVKVAHDWATQAAVITQCERSGAKISASGANASEAKSAEVSVLLKQYADYDGRCRGTEGAQNPAVCTQRNEVAVRLNRLNYCYAKVGEYGYQHDWHICGPTSIRATNG